MSEPICEEKMRLMEEYQHTTARYSAAVNRLAKRMGVVRSEYFDELIAVTYKARQASIEAREQLERHIAQHGC
jgi:hypothetical protein